jgi:hypothetical protein
MATISINNAAELLRKHRAVYWKVWDRSKRAEIDAQNDPIDLEDSIGQFLDTVNALSGDAVALTFYTGKPTRKTAGEEATKTFSVLVKLQAENARITGPERSTTGPTLADHLALHEQLTALKLEKLKIELSAQEKKESAVEKFLGNLIEGGHLQNIIGAIMTKSNQPKPGVVSGVSETLAETMAKFSKFDPDYQNTLKKMAEYLEKNPGQLGAIKMVIGA